MKSIATLALATLAGLSTAAAADLPSMKDYRHETVTTGESVKWSGFYGGVHAGWGIASHSITTTTVTDFAATPSRCWARGAFNSSNANWVPDINIGDSDPNTPGNQDDRTHVIEADGGISITDVTAEECDELRDELGLINPTPTLPAGSGLTIDSGYDPAVAAHSITDTVRGTHSDSGFVGGVRVGYDIAFSRLLAGVFGEYNWSAIDGKDGDWTVGGRAGLLLGPRLLAYGLVGYTQADYGSVDFQGISVGGGMEYALTNNMFVGLEYTHTFYDEETLIDTANLKITDELDEDRILATFKFKFN